MTAQPLGLAAQWREEAKALRKRGAEFQATVLESCAAELEQNAKESDLEALTLEQAARESGFSYSALQKQVADGRIVNAGSKHKPRIRRADLPRKARRSVPSMSRSATGPELAEAVLGG